MKINSTSMKEKAWVSVFDVYRHFEGTCILLKQSNYFSSLYIDVDIIKPWSSWKSWNCHNIT